MGKDSFLQKMKLMTIVGTRPEVIKLSEIIKKCDKYFEHILVHTGQNYDYELNQIFFSDLELRKPDVFLDVSGEDAGQTMGRIIESSFQLIKKEMPDAILVLGDTNSCLSVISAKRLKIPVFHMEAGNRCRDENLPEEVIRRIVDVTSDVNLCYSEEAKNYLLSAGGRPEFTFIVGSPMYEVLSKQIHKIHCSNVLKQLNLKERNYVVLSAHREENIDNEKNFYMLMSAVNMVAKKYDMPILYSCHPRAEKMINQRKQEFDNRILRHKPLSFRDYNYLQENSYCVISDSGTLPEESAFYSSIGKPFPSVSIRTSTERQEAMQEGVFLLSGITEDGILNAIETAVKMQEEKDCGSDVAAYMDKNVSTKIVKIIQSYTNVINQMVWRKS